MSEINHFKTATIILGIICIALLIYNQIQFQDEEYFEVDGVRMSATSLQNFVEAVKQNDPQKETLSVCHLESKKCFAIDLTAQ